jgi:hypothetical protein
VQFELGKKHEGPAHRRYPTAAAIDLRTHVARRRRRATRAGSTGERGARVGAFDAVGTLNLDYVDRFRRGIRARHSSDLRRPPTRPVSSASLPALRARRSARQTFGWRNCSGSRSFRRGLHSDAFGMPNLPPSPNDPLSFPQRWNIEGPGDWYITSSSTAFLKARASIDTRAPSSRSDVIRATTTIATAVALGRECFPVPTIEAASRGSQPSWSNLFSFGELGGKHALRLSILNTQSAGVGTAHRRSSSDGHSLDFRYTTHHRGRRRGGSLPPLRCANYRAQAAHAGAHHSRIAVIGAGRAG